MLRRFSGLPFKRMPFGLSNAPMTFQRAIDHILGKLGYVKVFIDDILIQSKDETQHFVHLKTVLEILQKNVLSINFDKIKFFLSEVCFLGHVISPKGIKPKLERLKPLK